MSATSSATRATHTETILIDDVLFRVVPTSAATTRFPRRAVVFVHGFTGNAKDTWRLSDSTESFASLLATDSQLPDYDFYLFQYVTSSLHPPAIDNIVVQLKTAIKAHIRATPIVFIAHSMGGLVSMSCILALLDEMPPPSIAGLLLFGCPMTGVEWAKYAQLVLKLGGIKLPILNLVNKIVATNKQVEALAAGSEFIDRLNNRWITRCLNGGHPKVLTSQRAWFPVRVVSGNDDWVVKQSSAQGFYADIDWVNVNENHRALVKPQGRSEFTYQIARDFLTECRGWMNPGTLLKLRQQLDSIWCLHQARTIANWQFELSFERDEVVSNGSRFGVAGFYPFAVLKCSYHRRIEHDFLNFGFAIGHIAAGAMWNNDFAFLHSIRLGALDAAEGQLIRDRLHALLRNPDVAWSELFDHVDLQIRHPEEEQWHALNVGRLEASEDGLIRTFVIPHEAAELVGQNAIVKVAFRGLLPAAIRDYTVEFPWLCDGFVTRVAVNGHPTFLIASQAMRGQATLESKKEHSDKMEYSSKDLILPGSYLRFEWGFADRGES
jgi:pimeloyl-ACP methyl ester carboxylesterase